MSGSCESIMMTFKVIQLSTDSSDHQMALEALSQLAAGGREILTGGTIMIGGGHSIVLSDLKRKSCALLADEICLHDNVMIFQVKKCKSFFSKFLITKIQQEKMCRSAPDCRFYSLGSFFASCFRFLTARVISG